MNGYYNISSGNTFNNYFVYNLRDSKQFPQKSFGSITFLKYKHPYCFCENLQVRAEVSKNFSFWYNLKTI